MKKRYKKCCECNNKAVWCYMPSGDGRHHYCDDCVPRGCTCNLHDIKEDGILTVEELLTKTNKKLNNINKC